ncbi:MAG: hypothetical protein PHR21_08420, partial [Oscillospiraceae bacterium]|nr:hypothetical protein [Oscillospiraceae bacterium]
MRKSRQASLRWLMMSAVLVLLLAFSWVRPLSAASADPTITLGRDGSGNLTISVANPAGNPAITYINFSVLVNGTSEATVLFDQDTSGAIAAGTSHTFTSTDNLPDIPLSAGDIVELKYN